MDNNSTKKCSAQASGHDSSYRETSQRTVGESSRSELMQNQTAQLKKGLLSRRGHSRTKTLSSIHLPTGVRDLTPRDGWGLARRTMPRADSFQVLGSIFSRSTKKDKKDQLMEASSDLSSDNSLVIETAYSETSKDMNERHQALNPRSNGLRNVKRALKEQRSCLMNKSRTELVSKHSNSSSTSASVDLDINDTKYEDLYFENFSSESVGMKIFDDFQSPLLEKNLHIQERAVLRKKPKNDAIPGWPTKMRREMRTCQPPWSPPSSNPSPRGQPLSWGNSQTSLSSENSKVFYSENPAEIIWNNPYPFGIPTPPSRSGHHEFFSQTSCDSPTASYKKPWPLPDSISTSVQGHVKLAKHENYGSLSQRRNQESRRCNAVPQNQAENAQSNTLESQNQRQKKEVAQIQEQIPSLTFETESESWESDIDWCYEHEVEADCDYQWVEDGQTNSQDKLPQTLGKFQPEYPSVPNEEFDSMSFRAPLLSPTQLDVPYLSISPESSIYPEISMSVREKHSPQYPRSRVGEYNAHSSSLKSNNCRTPCEQAVFQHEQPRNNMSPQISPLYPYNPSNYHGKNRSSSVPLNNQSLYQNTTRSSSITNIPSERFLKEDSLENLSTKVDEILPLFSPKQTLDSTPNTERNFALEHSVRPAFQSHSASKWDLGAMRDCEATNSVGRAATTPCGTSSEEPIMSKKVSRPGLARRKYSMPLECRSRKSSLVPARTGGSCSYGLFPQV